MRVIGLIAGNVIDARRPRSARAVASRCALRALQSIAVCVAITLAGCGDREKAPKPKVAAEGWSLAALLASDARAQTQTGQAQQERDRMVADAEHRAAQLRADLDRLKRQAQSASGEARARLERRIREMEPRWREIDARLARLRTQSGKALEDARAGFGKAIDALRQSYRQAKEEFDRS